MRPNKTADPAKMQDYYLKTTSRSVVFEINNLSDLEFTIQDSLIIHGDELICPFPDKILSLSNFTIGHGSNGFCTGVEGLVKYIEKGGSQLNIHWMVEFFGKSFIKIELNNHPIKITEMKDSTKSNLMFKSDITNEDKNLLMSFLY